MQKYQAMEWKQVPCLTNYRCSCIPSFLFYFSFNFWLFFGFPLSYKGCFLILFMPLSLHTWILVVFVLHLAKGLAKEDNFRMQTIVLVIISFHTLSQHCILYIRFVLNSFIVFPSCYSVQHDTVFWHRNFGALISRLVVPLVNQGRLSTMVVHQLNHPRRVTQVTF